MKDIDKLRHLVHHWIAHNEEHARAYLQWAEKADSLGRKGLSETLKEIALRTRELEALLRKAEGELR